MLTQSNKNKLTRSKQGFTIIEVMIVLAIAGLILLIVFLAVPALQRSSRNQQRKTDVGRIGSAATTVISDNNGAIPTPNATFQTDLQNEVGNLSYYTSADVTTAASTAAIKYAPNTSTVVVYYPAVCASGASGLGASSTGAQNTQLAIVYETETGGATADNNCVSD